MIKDKKIKLRKYKLLILENVTHINTWLFDKKGQEKDLFFFTVKNPKI